VFTVDVGVSRVVGRGKLSRIFRQCDAPVLGPADELWLFRPFAGSPFGLFALWLVRLLACSLPG